MLYRGAQKLLRNVHEHAGASNVEVAATVRNGSVQLMVTDDGIGFSTAHHEDRQRAGHMGIDLQRALVHRLGGTLTVNSAPGFGTTVTAAVPQ